MRLLVFIACLFATTAHAGQPCTQSYDLRLDVVDPGFEIDFCVPARTGAEVEITWSQVSELADLVNDLDLVLVAPDGSFHFPTSSASSGERVYVPKAMPGRWVARVTPNRSAYASGVIPFEITGVCNRPDADDDGVLDCADDCVNCGSDPEPGPTTVCTKHRAKIWKRTADYYYLCAPGHSMPREFDPSRLGPNDWEPLADGPHKKLLCEVLQEEIEVELPSVSKKCPKDPVWMLPTNTY